MSMLMNEEIKRWTARRKTALMLEVIQGKTTVAEDGGKRGMENALKANPQDIRGQYERQLKDLQEAYGEAMLELRARIRWVITPTASSQG